MFYIVFPSLNSTFINSIQTFKISCHLLPDGCNGLRCSTDSVVLPENTICHVDDASTFPCKLCCKSMEQFFTVRGFHHSNNNNTQKAALAKLPLTIVTIYLYCIIYTSVKNEVGSRDDTAPKTVKTRGYCEED